MKTTVLLLSFLFGLLFQANAQGLIVTYEETRTLPSLAGLSQITDPQLRASIDRQLREHNAPRLFQLFVSNGTSVYKAKEPDRETRTNRSHGNVNVNIRRHDVNIHTVYKNHYTQLVLARATLGNREHLVEEPQAPLEWTIGTERREVSGFQAINANAMLNGQPITAWFTPDIPISEGPSLFWGLPGLILYVNTNNGQRVFSATSVERTNDVPAIHMPDGERISGAELNRMEAQLRQRTLDGIEGEAEGGVIIRRHTM